MKVFADTSGIFALLVGNDSMHQQARLAFADYSKHRAQLFTSSFIMVETTALLQRRIGLPAVRDLNKRILPLFDIVWTDKEWYYYIVIQGDSPMNNPITIRLPEELRKALQDISKRENVPVSDIVRESLRKYISIHRFRKLRDKVLPFAEAQGLLTDEDIFKELD
jgi:predicted transcriptional regulator